MTEANRVFLLEPGFNPALEQQAVGRVHRLGQKRKVEIVRLIVKNSIETRIRAFLEHKYGKRGSAKDEEAAIGPVGNVATERPKSKILAEEFDILFGVESAKNISPKRKKPGTTNQSMPDEAPSSGFL